jgi:IS30 family transposase
MASHLSMQEREIISQMRYGGRKAAGIARRLGRHRSTIYRELARNRDSRVIRPCAPSDALTSDVAIDRWCARWTSRGSAGKYAKD